MLQLIWRLINVVRQFIMTHRRQLLLDTHDTNTNDAQS